MNLVLYNENICRIKVKFCLIQDSPMIYKEENSEQRISVSS